VAAQPAPPALAGGASACASPQASAETPSVNARGRREEKDVGKEPKSEDSVRLYAAAYHSRLQPPPSRPSETAAALYAAAASSEFPYDSGDDPAFFSARHHNGPITWGVCRPDVRRAIRPGDWMVFFSLKWDEEARLTRYRFSAALCVQEKLTHTDLFGSPAPGPYSEYLNLLIRPRGSGWEHYEPSLHPRLWHTDWLWRICRDRRLGAHKSEVVNAGERHHPGQPLPFPPAQNYVVFATKSALIARNPPLVATHRRGDSAEIWENDRGARAIRAAVFGGSLRALRIDNPQRAHRHIRRPLHDPAWPKPLHDALALTEWQRHAPVQRIQRSVKAGRSQGGCC
jgi:hypothetical protein